MTRWTQEEYEVYKKTFDKNVGAFHPDVIKKPIRHKYNAQRTERNGFKFDSKREAKRYDELVLLQALGEVIFFLRQVPFHLPGNVTYRLDFLIFWASGSVTCEDVKGVKTKEYIIKKKLVESIYPVEIKEVYNHG